VTKSTKRLLFYSAVAVFLILSYVVILYAQGYKYSFSENKFFKTGAVYLRVNTSANIYLDDKFLGNTSFFNDSYRIEGLLPDKYTVKVQKENHSTWEKVIIVEEGFVSEFSKIMILPQEEDGIKNLEEEINLLFLQKTPLSKAASTSEPYVIKKGIFSTTGETPKKIADNVKGFIVSKDKNKLAWWTINNEVWVMWLSDTNYQPYHIKEDKELITKFSTQIKKAAWFRDEDHLIVSLEKDGYKILEIDIRDGVNII